MDPFTSLGLAGNIVQFVDFGWRLFHAAGEISSSALGSTYENQELGHIATHLQALCKKLRDSSRSDPVTGLSESADPELLTLARNCKSTGENLLMALQSLQAKDDGKAKRWKSFRVALKSVWKKKDIDSMCTLLEKYKSSVTLHLVHRLTYRDLPSTTQFYLLDRANANLDSLMETKIDMLKTELVSTIRKLVSDFRHDMQTQRVQYHVDIDKWLDQRKAQLEYEKELSMRQISAPDRLYEIATDCRNMALTVNFLRSLQYHAMKTRQSSVATAHPGTFQWIYESQFSHWMESEEPTYWISGKPGSGKSTLMKYLVQNIDTRRHLEQWAGDRKLVLAPFYFWISGTDMQKSQNGLLQSLLYEVCVQSPEIIPMLSPDRWKENANSGWTLQELIDTVARLTTFDAYIAFCFFIDGLDEYKGDHNALIALIQSLRSSNVKICLSSRPWNVFEAAFGDGSTPKVYVQDLTASDMRRYITDFLESRKDFRDLKNHDARYDELIVEVVERAQGVFLWVFLVVRSLIEGLENCDSITYLQKRLRECPSDLQEFFAHMFNSLPPIYKLQAAKAFQVTLAAHNPLTVFNHWFIDLEEEDPAYAMRDDFEALDDDQLKKRAVQMQRRLMARCRCLLEVSRVSLNDVFSQYQVQVLHRTVRDFLQTEEIQRLLLRWHGEDFNAHRSICKATAAEIQTTPVKIVQFLKRYPIHYLLEQFIMHAKEVEMLTNRSLHDEIDHVAAFLFKNMRLAIATLDRELLYRGTWRGRWTSANEILTFAVSWDLCIYIRQKLAESPHLARDMPRVWDYFLEKAAESGPDVHASTKATIQQCIRNGADMTILSEYIHQILPPQEVKQIMAQEARPTIEQEAKQVMEHEASTDKKLMWVRKRDKLLSIFRR